MDTTPEIEYQLNNDLCEDCKEVEELPLQIRPQIEIIAQYLEAECENHTTNWENLHDQLTLISNILNKDDMEILKLRLNAASEKMQDSTDALLEAVTIEIIDAGWETPEEYQEYIKARKIFIKLQLDLNSKRILRLMSDALSRSACLIQRLTKSIFNSILILFGMCSSRPRYIYAAIFGSSSTRVFS